MTARAPLSIIAAVILIAAAPRPATAAADAPFDLLPPGPHRADLERPEAGRALSARHPGWLRFLAAHRGPWKADWNGASGAPHRIYGGAIVLDAAGGGDGASAEAALRRLLAAHRDLFRVDDADLELEASRDLGPFRTIRFRQVRRGAPVLGSRVEAWIAPGGRVILLGADVLPSRLLGRLPAEPLAGPDRAEAAARSHAGPDQIGIVSRRLVVLPVRDGRGLPGRGIEARLAWEIRSEGSEPGSAWVYLVAADDPPPGGAGGPGGGEAPAGPGTVLGRWDRTSRGSIGGIVRGHATPNLLPDLPWNPPAPVPLPHLRVTAGGDSAVTGPDGRFSIGFPGSGAVTVGASLRGPWCEVESAAGGDLLFSDRLESGSEVPIEFNATPSPAATAQVNAFREVNRAHDLVKEIDPSFADIDRPIRVRVNVDDSCNAFFLPEGDGILGFFVETACPNTAYSTVIHHEYAHFVAWRAFGGGTPMRGLNEGMADSFAALLTDQPVIGASINKLPGDGAVPIRDISGPLRTWPDDLLGDPYEAGLILAGGMWDLRLALGEEMGSGAGLAHVRKLWLGSLLLAPPFLGPDLVLDLLALDDDDGDLSDGTPHFDAILGAFALRGLPPPGLLEIAHQPLVDISGGGPIAVEAEVRSDLGLVAPSRVVLRVSIDGGFRYGEVEMAPAGGDAFRVEIPRPPSGTTARYRIEAEAPGGLRAVFPDAAAGAESLAFTSGDVEEVFDDGFDGPERGWIHGILPGAGDGARDDWERGEPRTGTIDPEDPIDGNLIDPPSAFSPPGCWGNDIGLGPRADRNHAADAECFLESPPVDCRGKFGIRLRLRRWLTLERGDRARIVVVGRVVWESPADRDVFDAGWKPVDLDIAEAADDRPDVRVRFELSANGVREAGGWTIDDVWIVAAGAPPHPRPAIDSIEPAIAFKTGGAPFRLEGSGFTGTAATRLFLGDDPVEDFAVLDAGTIEGTVPPGAPGPRAISLENENGAGALPEGFTYFDLPVLEAITPARGNVAGGAMVTVRGESFTPGTAVLIDGRPLLRTSQFDGRIILGTVPSGNRTGPVEVTLRSVFGESRFPGAFAYDPAPPKVVGIEPPYGPLGGGTRFVLTASWFPADLAGVEVTLGGVPATALAPKGSTGIEGIAPSGAVEGPVDVRLATPDGSAVLAGGFRFHADGLPIFIRGDVDLDGVIEITDAIRLLGFLFLGDGPIPCLDAGDGTDDGKLDISDPLAILVFLFAGGLAPPDPHPSPGPDFTEDGLGCSQVAGER